MNSSKNKTAKYMTCDRQGFQYISRGSVLIFRLKKVVWKRVDTKYDTRRKGVWWIDVEGW